MTAKKFKVLIADDDYLSVKLLKLNFKKQFDEVYEAANGRQAVEIVKKIPDIDLIFMDMKMPELDGYQATKYIKQINPSIKIIAQTSYAMAGDREKTLDAGCDAYFSKPIDMVKLEHLVEELTGHHEVSHH